jgi:hypothetical protein
MKNQERILGFTQAFANHQVSKPKKQVEILTLKKEYNIASNGLITEDKVSSIEVEKRNAHWE